MCRISDPRSENLPHISHCTPTRSLPSTDMVTRGRTLVPSTLVSVIVQVFLLVTSRRDCVCAQQQRSAPDGTSKDERIVLQMGLGETVAERHASWRALHQDGYSCWLGARKFDKAVCILVSIPPVCWKYSEAVVVDIFELKSLGPCTNAWYLSNSPRYIDIKLYCPKICDCTCWVDRCHIR